MSRASVIDREEGAIRTRHRPPSPATTDALIEELAGDLDATSLAAHIAAGDPHTGYQLESQKDAPSGYAGLSAGSKLTGTQQVYGSSANTACEGNDARLSDARTPTAHTHPQSDVTGLVADLAAKQSTTPGTWSAAALQNSWIDFGGAYGGAAYMKDNEGVVHLRGLIKDGTTTAGTLLFTLPVGYRPPAMEMIIVVTDGAFCALNIASNGQVSLALAAGAGYLSLSAHFST